MNSILDSRITSKRVAKVDEMDPAVVPRPCAFEENETVTATIFKPSKDSTVGISVQKNATDSRFVVGRISGLCKKRQLAGNPKVQAVSGFY